MLNILWPLDPKNAKHAQFAQKADRRKFINMNQALLDLTTMTILVFITIVVLNFI